MSRLTISLPEQRYRALKEAAAQCCTLQENSGG